MTARTGALLLTLASVVSYHIAQRATPGSLRPAMLFGFVYTAAAVAMITATLVDSGTAGLFTPGRHWAPWLLVASVVGIEIGVLAMYRTGWPLATANLTTQAITAVALVGIGAVAFAEPISPSRAAGVALCLTGAWLIAH